MTNDRFSLSDFHSADREGVLVDLCCEYLDTVGNNKKLSEIIKNTEKLSAKCVQVNTKDLVRVMGPVSEGLLFSEPDELWEKRVEQLIAAINSGEYEPSPLILTNFWGDIHVSDGNHRLEAFRRLGYESCFVVILEK